MSTLTGWDAFDPRKTFCRRIISDRVRQRPDALRSLHPVHSVAAIGLQARNITEGHEHCPTGCGEGTPYMKVAELGGKVMLLGVDMDRNTMMHTLEELADVRYLLTLDIPAPLYPHYHGKGSFTLKKFPPGHRDYLSITPLLRREGVMIEGKIGDAVTKVIDAQGLLRVALPILRENPLHFICENEHCNFCRFARNQYGSSNLIHHENHCLDPVCEISSGTPIKEDVIWLSMQFLPIFLTPGGSLKKLALLHTLKLSHLELSHRKLLSEACPL